MADPGSPSLVSPADGTNVVGNVIVFTFTIPTDSDNDNLIFRLQMDRNDPINTGSSDYFDHESRNALDKKTNGHWQVKNGSGVYIDMPTGGVDSSFYGRDARVSIRKQDTLKYPVTEGIWYWRIGASDGLQTNPVYNQVIFAQAIFGGS